MKTIDDMDLVNLLGLSRELTEYSQTEARVYNCDDNKWAIQINPPIERSDLIYFILYDHKFLCDIITNKTKMARISMMTPEYIHCNDSSKEEWILTEEERDQLYEILTKDNNKIWEMIKSCYHDELQAYDERNLNLSDLEIPDYSKLPTI